MALRDITMPKNNKKSSDEGQNKKSTVRPPAKSTAQRNREYRARQKALRNAVNQCTAANQPSTSACVNNVYGDITSTTTSQEQVADSHRSIVVQVDVHQKSTPVLLDEPSTSAVREDNGRNITRTAKKPTAKTSTERSREYRKRIARAMKDVIETQATLMETARHKTSAERTRAYRARMRAKQHTDVPEPAIEQLRANSPALSVNSNISTLFNMDPYTIVKDENLEVYDEFAKVRQEMADNFYTFLVPKEETDVQEDVKFNPETILPDKFTVGLSTTHEGIASNSSRYMIKNVDKIHKHHDKLLKSIDGNI